MLYKDFYVGDCAEQFLCISEEDKADIAAGANCLEPRIAIEMGAIRELPSFRAVHKLVLLPGELNGSCAEYFRGCSARELKIDYYTDEIDDYTIDISNMRQLRYVFTRSLYGIRNVNQATHLKAIKIGEWCEPDFHYLEGAPIEALQILTGKIRDMSGIRELKDLRFLSIANCPGIKDFSGLGECPRLESLVLENCGPNVVKTMPVIPGLKYLNIRTASIPDAAWFQKFPDLEYLILDAKIEDGRIEYFQKLKHCVLVTDRRHYSMRDKDLPKSKTVLPIDAYNYELAE